MIENASVQSRSWGVTVAVSSIGSGAVIYLFFRSRELLYFSVLQNTRLAIYISEIQSQVSSLRSAIPNWIIFNLPDGLWVYGFCTLIHFIWVGSESKMRIVWILSIPTAGLVSEVLQYLSLIPGTFDMLDLAAYDSGFVIFYVQYYRDI